MYPSEVAAVERSTMTTSSVFWTAAAYNNGVVVPAIGAQKIRFSRGERYGPDGIVRSIGADPPPSADDLLKGILPVPAPAAALETVPPGDVFRVFERGGSTIPSSFRYWLGSLSGHSRSLPAATRPSMCQSNRGPGTGLRISVPLLNVHKTRQ